MKSFPPGIDHITDGFSITLACTAPDASAMKSYIIAARGTNLVLLSLENNIEDRGKADRRLFWDEIIAFAPSDPPSVEILLDNADRWTVKQLQMMMSIFESTSNS